LQLLVYIPIWWPDVAKAEWEIDGFPTQSWQRPVTTWVYKPEAANTIYSSWWWTVCRSKHVEHSINSGIINSITKLHLVGISIENFTICLLQINEMKNFHPNDWITNCFQHSSLHYSRKCKIATENLISYRQRDWKNTSHCALCGPQS
jgi:hypothetical protein